MTPPLTLSLLCDKSRLFIAKRIAGLLYFHKRKERQGEREILQLVDSFEILCRNKTSDGGDL